MTTTQLQKEALRNVTNSASTTNYIPIFLEFQKRGIKYEDIKPRENIFTFHAWKALGRVVKKGERGVKIVTYIPVKGTKEDQNGEKSSYTYRRPRNVSVFHISQTEKLVKKV